MRLVPATNAQKPSTPKLTIRLSAEPGQPVRQEDSLSESLPSANSQPAWAALAAIDWADQKNFWRLAPAGSPP
jgi:hypothetical protein